MVVTPSFFAVLFAALVALASFASTAAFAAVPPTSKVQVSLKSLQEQPGPIKLSGSQSEAVVAFPVTARQRVSNVELALYVTNSIALKQRSQMAVSLNGSIVAQVPFTAKQPETRARIVIPTELIQPGYNQLTFSVAQHYTENCEDPAAPELWSEIDTSRSHLSYTLQPRAIQASLANLPALMDKRLLGDYSLVIATSAVPDDIMIEAGALVSQAAALARDYMPVKVHHRLIPSAAARAEEKVAPGITALPKDLFAEHDGVLLGTREELAPWLDAETYTRAARPLLALFPFGQYGERFVLVVSGADSAQVRDAARGLAQGYSTLPATAQANIGDLATLALPPQQMLAAGVPLSFAELGFETVTRQGIYPESMRLHFWVPADRFARPNSELNLHLHLAYGAGLGPQSTLNVFLNRHFEHAIHLTEGSGAVYYNYRIPIPISSLIPGWNQLEFSPGLMPQRAGGQCEPIFTGNLLLTLFDDSYLVFDAMGKLAQLPDLSLWTRTGYPFVGNKHGAPLNLVLTRRDSGNLSAGWTLLAKMAQLNHLPIVNVSSTTADKAGGNILLVGQAGGVPERLLQASALQRDGWLMLGATDEGDVRPGLRSIFQGNKTHATGDKLQVSIGDLMKRNLLLTQFESPTADERSVLMILSDSSDALATAVNTLTDDRYWGLLAGGTAVFLPENGKVMNYAPANTYLVGDAGIRARLSLSFEQQPIFATVLILAGILFFAFITWRMLLSYRRRHHGGQGV